MRTAFWAFLLLQAGWACSGGREGQGPSVVAPIAVVGGEVDESGAIRLNFGEQVVGTTDERKLILRNEGDETVALAFDVPSSPFLLARAMPSLPAGAEAPLLFRFSPTEPGVFEGEAIVEYAGGSIEIGLRGRAREEGECMLESSTSALRFTVGPDEPAFARVGRLRIANAGDRICRLRSLRTEGDPAFSIDHAGIDALAPGQSSELHIRFIPGQGVEALLVIEAEGADLRVALGTKTANQCLRTKGEEGTVNVVGLGCSPGVVEAENTCDDPLAISFGASVGFLLGGERRPVRIDGQSAEALVLDYAPTEAPWEREGDFVLHAENGDRLWWRLGGELEWGEETFQAVPSESQDHLIVLDVAESLADYRSMMEGVAHNIASSMEYDWEVDHRIHVTTTSIVAEEDCLGEAGRLIPLDGARPRTVTWETPDREAVLVANLRPPACQTYGGQGLAAIEAALGEDGWPEWRQGYLFVSLFSVDDDASPHDVVTYLEKFDREIGGGRRYVDFLVVVVPNGCEGIEDGSRYLSLSPWANVTPICSHGDGATSVEWYKFQARLSGVPADLNGDHRLDANDGIEIFVDDEPYPARWEIGAGWLDMTMGHDERFVVRGSRVDLRYARACK